MAAAIAGDLLPQPVGVHVEGQRGRPALPAPAAVRHLAHVAGAVGQPARPARPDGVLQAVGQLVQGQAALSAAARAAARGRRCPARVAMTRPSSGVKPIVVSTLRRP